MDCPGQLPESEGVKIAMNNFFSTFSFKIHRNPGLYPMCYSFTVPDEKGITVRKLHVMFIKAIGTFFSANSLKKNAFHHF